MKLNKQNRKLNSRIWVWTLLVSLLIGTSCNKSFPDAANKLKADYPSDTANLNFQNRKVLYLILDGAQGSEIDSLKPTNISRLAKNAIYTYLGISGSNSYDTELPGAWTTMMTGVNTQKTKVVSGFDTANLDQYPSFVTRLKQSAPNLKVSAFASSALFSQYLVKDAAVNTLTNGDDGAVTQNVITNLKNDSAKVVIGQFHSIATAGDTYGYNFHIPQYATAINKVDGYIGNIIDALKSRPNYSRENWLIVVASNENGMVDNNTGDSTSAYNDTRRNSFIIFNNERFQPVNVGKNGTPSTKGLSAYTDSTLLLTGQGSTGVNIKANDPKRIYDFKKGTSATIEFKIKFLPVSIKGGQYFLNMVSTATGFYASGNGWAFWRYGNGLIFYISDANGHYTNMGFNTQISDNSWHSISATMNWPSNETQVHVNLYIDGVIDRTDVTQTLSNDLTSGNPLVIGHGTTAANAGNYTDYYITDVRYWNTALPYETISQYNCKTNIPSTSPYINNLVANYKINDGNGSTVITDLSKTKQNATVFDPSGLETWIHFSEVSNAVCPGPDANFYKATPNSLDIPLEIIQWLGVIPQPSWSLEGQFWNSGYTDVQLPNSL